jgi:multidrug efflux pump subunit AcrA (membrane-fusion protein)
LSEESLAGFADFCRQVHASLDPTATATAIANAARAWIGCDRVTVLLHRDPKWRVAAISGMSAFDRRSGAVRRLQSVVGSVLAPASGGREPAGAAWIAPAAAVPGVSAAEDLSDAARAEIDAFRDEVQYRHLAILPLTNVVDSLRESADRSRSQPSPLGALVLEHFTDAGWDSPLRRRAELAADQGGAALSAVREHRALPLFPFVRALQRLGWRSKGRTLSRWLLAAIVAAAIIAALTLVPTDFDITGNGELQPKLRRHVFATLRGTVESLDVRHGQQVAEGQSLLRLRSPELDFELTRVQGELRTTEQQIADLGALRTGLERPGAAARQSSVELAAREEELKSVLANLTEQLAVLRRQQAELSVASPIAGEVLTWDVEEILASRPVEPGHRLLTVADAAGAWVVEVRVPDRDISHVLAARRENNEGPDVSFVVATDLEREQHGQVIDVANAVEHDPVEGPTLLVTVAVDREQLGDVRPGASVYPRIHCGRRAVGYVWFRRAIEAVVAWWRF